MKKLSLALMLAASPACAESEPFFTLRSTEFVVTVAFLLFIGVLIYFKVPALLGGLLDKRAAGIKSDLDTARALHDEAKAVLASYEQKQKEMLAQADMIVTNAKTEAQAAAEQAKLDLQASIARRLQTAQDQIASAETAAVKAVKDQAVSVAVAAAGDLIAGQMAASDKGALIDSAIRDVAAKLH